DAQRADPSQWHALHLDGWPAGSLNGRFRYAVDTRARPSALLDAKLAASEWQGWRADSAVVPGDMPPTAPGPFPVVGVRRGGALELQGKGVAAGGWSGPYTLRDLPLEEWPDGAATGLKGVLERAEGTVESRDGALFVSGDLAGRDTRWAAATVANWTLAGGRGRPLPTPRPP